VSEFENASASRALSSLGPAASVKTLDPGYVAQHTPVFGPEYLQDRYRRRRFNESICAIGPVDAGDISTLPH